MTDSKEQAQFVGSLRKFAEDAAAKNPILADMRALGKILVAEKRKQIAGGDSFSPLGAYMTAKGEIEIVRPSPSDDSAGGHILLELKYHANEGTIRAAALCQPMDKQVPGGPVVKFIQVHMEHVSGKAFISAIPADESDLSAGLPGVRSPAVSVFGKPTKSIIFSQ
jgi:hypothetical protein